MLAAAASVVVLHKDNLIGTVTGGQPRQLIRLSGDFLEPRVLGDEFLLAKSRKTDSYLCMVSGSLTVQHYSLSISFVPNSTTHLKRSGSIAGILMTLAL